jgi:cytochrome c biogenesis protein ResB
MNWKKIKENKSIRFLGSVKIALILLWAIIIVSFIGAVVPAKMRPYVFAAPWFIWLLAVFSLNLLFCVLARMSFTPKKIGVTLVHLSVLLILSGSLLSHLFSVRGILELEEGQSRDSFNAGGTIRKLGFQVYLEDFALSWYSTTPDKYEIKTLVVDQNLKSSYKLDKDQEQKIGDTGYSFSVIDYLPNFGLDEKMKPFNKSAVPDNPAVLLQINSSEVSEKRWVFAKHPGMGRNKDPNIRFLFNYMPVIKEFRSQLKITDEIANRTTSANIRVNFPFSHKGYTFYQSGYDQGNLKFTSLDVVRDPGVGFVFAGFLLLNLGLVVIFYPKLKKVSKSRI